MRKLTCCTVLVLCGVLGAPTANAGTGVGNFELRIPDRYDFHTWIWALASCGVDCREVRTIAQPVARATTDIGMAQRVAGQWTYTFDAPEGLRCGNVYYGQTIPTHDVYVWNDVTQVGTLTSTFDAGCDGQPGVLTYPFSLVRL